MPPEDDDGSRRHLIRSFDLDAEPEGPTSTCEDHSRPTGLELEVRGEVGLGRRAAPAGVAQPEVTAHQDTAEFRQEVDIRKDEATNEHEAAPQHDAGGEQDRQQSRSRIRRPSAAAE